MTAPFMSVDGSNNNPSNLKKANIFPIGFHIDNSVINAFLDVAFKNGLLTKEERESITGYELYRSDRRTDRTIVAKGLLFNMLSYVDVNRQFKTTFYPNYPLNDNGGNALLSFDSLNGGASENRPVLKGNSF